MSGTGKLTAVLAVLVAALALGIEGAAAKFGPPVLLKDVDPRDSSFPANLTNVNGTLFFTADDGANGVELWKSGSQEERCW